MRDEAGWVFFDRGVVEAAVVLQHATGRPVRDMLRSSGRYHTNVFPTPSRPEI